MCETGTITLSIDIKYSVRDVLYLCATEWAAILRYWSN